MKLIGSTVAVAIGLSLIATIGFGAYLVLTYTVTLLAQLHPQVATVTGIACISGLSAAFIIARAIRSAVLRSAVVAPCGNRATTYRLFVEFWSTKLGQHRGRAEQFTATMPEKQTDLERQLAIYGGIAVVQAHALLRALEREKGAEHPDVRATLGRALVIIRTELGTDTPRDAACELEQLVLPPLAADDSATPARDPSGRTVLSLGR